MWMCTHTECEDPRAPSNKTPKPSEAVERRRILSWKLQGDMLDEAQADVYKEEWLTLKVAWMQSNWGIYFKISLCEETIPKKDKIWYILVLPQIDNLICDF